MNKIYLLPGQIALSKEPALISTILGSCVAVALFDASQKIAGLNHYLLARVPKGEKPSERYGEYAMSHLIAEMLRLGARRPFLQAKVYGGGAVLAGVSIGNGVGRDNVAFAFESLALENIPIVEKNVGGNESRKIVLNTSNFSVQHQFNSHESDPNVFQALAKIGSRKS